MGRLIGFLIIRGMKLMDMFSAIMSVCMHDACSSVESPLVAVILVHALAILYFCLVSLPCIHDVLPLEQDSTFI